MDVDEYMKKRGHTDADLDAMAAPYEAGDYTSGGDPCLYKHIPECDVLAVAPAAQS